LIFKTGVEQERANDTKLKIFTDKNATFQIYLFSDAQKNNEETQWSEKI
jgi:hypothetical protein